MNLHLEWLTPERLDDFCEFGQSIYPQRRNYAERFRMQVLENPFYLEDTPSTALLACDEAGKIVGFHGVCPSQIFLRGDRHVGYLGIDFYVLEAYRKSGIGKQLAEGILARSPFFAIGATPVSEHVYHRFTAATVAHIFRYFWLRGPLPLIYMAGATGLKARWPRDPQRVGDMGRLAAEVEADGVRFSRRQALPEWADAPWSDELLSFTRNADFLDYRFFQHPQHYQIYASADNDAYFVVRREHWRGLALLCVVDYRLPPFDATAFDAMLEACKRLTKMGGFDGLVAWSSLRFLDERLERQGFRRAGRPATIVANGDIGMDEKRIAQRNYMLSTLADYDQDFAAILD